MLFYWVYIRIYNSKCAHNSYLPVIGVHEMHGFCFLVSILLVVDLCSSLAYFMMTQPLPIAGKLPIKTLIAKRLPTNVHIHIIIVLHINSHTKTHWYVCAYTFAQHGNIKQAYSNVLGDSLILKNKQWSYIFLRDLVILQLSMSPSIKQPSCSESSSSSSLWASAITDGEARSTAVERSSSCDTEENNSSNWVKPTKERYMNKDCTTLTGILHVHNIMYTNVCTIITHSPTQYKINYCPYYNHFTCCLILSRTSGYLVRCEYWYQIVQNQQNFLSDHDAN